MGSDLGTSLAHPLHAFQQIDLVHGAASVMDNYARRNTKRYVRFRREVETMSLMGRRTSTDDKMLFAARLREQRELRGFETREAFAEKIGVQPHTYRQWERGGTEPGIANLVKIQRGLGVSLDYLIAGIVPGYASPPGFPEPDEAPQQQKTKRRTA